VGEAVTALITAAAPGIMQARCNPYGAEDGGPRGVMGGLYGPGSAVSPPESMPGLPDNVAQGEWACPQPAVIRVRMTCRCGHTGRVMNLCSWHDEEYYHGEFTAGVTRRVRDVRRVHGHYEEISRRGAGACTRCLFPGESPGWHRGIEAWQNELAYTMEVRPDDRSRIEYVKRQIEAIVTRFDEANADGTIHRCPMTLVPVS
jgi:hypothetical protein